MEEENLSRLDALTTPMRTFECQDTGRPNYIPRLSKECIAPEKLDIREGAQVMLIKNLDRQLVNGSVGIVSGFNDSHTEVDGEEGVPIVRFSNGVVRPIVREEWTIEIAGEGVVARRNQIPLILAWAM